MAYERIRRACDEMLRAVENCRTATNVLALLLPAGDADRTNIEAWVTGAPAPLDVIQTTIEFLREYVTPPPPAGTPLPLVDTTFAARVRIDFSTCNESLRDPIEDYAYGVGSPPGAAGGMIARLVTSGDAEIVSAAAVLNARLLDLRRSTDENLNFVAAIEHEVGQRVSIAGIQSAVSDVATYPVLTRELGYAHPFPSIAPANGKGNSLQVLVEGVVGEVLGYKPRLSDPRSFTTALTQSFNCRETQGRVVCEWVSRAGIGTAELGAALTGAQASLYERAKSALDGSLPMLQCLSPLRPDPDSELVDASRAIIETEFRQIVEEMGVEGGPRVERIDELFRILLDSDFLLVEDGTSIRNDPANAGLLAEIGAGELGRLADVMGLTRDNVNTLVEEQNQTSFILLRDHLLNIRQGWVAFRAIFLDQTQTFLGTHLVLLKRALTVVSESVDGASFAMDSVFFGPAERRTVPVQFPADFPNTPAPPTMFVEELLNWVHDYASEEGPRIIREGGRHGVRTLIQTLELLQRRVALGRIQHPAAGHPRVMSQLNELSQHLQQTAALASRI